MPHIRVRGLNLDQAVVVSSKIVKEISLIIESPEDHFTFEHIQTQFIAMGKIVNGNPFVEILWFNRDQGTQDACARVITDEIKNIVHDQDVTVVFTEVSKNGYYENSRHF